MKLIKKIAFLLLFTVVLLNFSTIETQSINTVNLIAGDEDTGTTQNVEIIKLS